MSLDKSEPTQLAATFLFLVSGLFSVHDFFFHVKDAVCKNKDVFFVQSLSL